MSRPYLSIIIPAYNEEHRLPSTLEQAFDFISRQPFLAEVLIVENGSSDRTYPIACQFAEEHPGFRVFQETKGKGGAIRKGMLEAQGEYCFMCDADLSMPIVEIRRFLPPVLSDFDLAIGSREAPGAERYDEPFYRHFGGRLINLLIRTLALPGIHDTQCGFKCLRRDVAVDLFSSLTLSNWSFDIELLYIARLREYRIVEVPIPWIYNPESKLNVYSDALRMILDILRIRRNARRGLYGRGNG